MKNELLRHILATITYRSEKCIQNFPEGFAYFRAGQGARTPLELIKHIRQVLDYAKAVVVNEKVPAENIPDDSFEGQIALFNLTVYDMDVTLSEIDLDLGMTKKLVQGPFSDVLTHIGQLAMLQRLSGGKPIEKENFFQAEIKPPSETTYILPEDQIIKIAEDLQCGLNSYIHKKTLKIKTLPNIDEFVEIDDGVWEEDRRELDENHDDYIHIAPMDSHEDFKVMEGFAAGVNETGLQGHLFRALNKRSPFANFKNIIDNAGAYRQKWFDYKNGQYVQYVKDQLELYNDADEREN